MKVETEGEVLERRARELARPVERAEQRTLSASVVVLLVGAAQVGIPRARLREVVLARDPAPLPGLPPCLLGLVAIRGEPICVVDLATLLELPSPGGARFLAVVEGPKGALALRADDLLELRDVFDDELALVLDGTTATPLLRHTTRDLLRLLDVDALFESPRIVAGPIDAFGLLDGGEP